MADIGNAMEPKVAVLTTRKGFPGTKALAIKSVLAGGGYPHRLGISETVLIFKQHLNFIGGMNALAEKIKEIKHDYSARRENILNNSTDELLEQWKQRLNSRRK